MSHTVTLLLAKKHCSEIPGQAETGVRRIESEIAVFMGHALGNGCSPIPIGCSSISNVRSLILMRGV